MKWPFMWRVRRERRPTRRGSGDSMPDNAPIEASVGD